ncbi:MAG: glucose-1-phosphate thymidylyltransferase RfbA, partial [Verrucomicrobiia bacterium]
TGTHQSLLDATHFIEAVEERQGLKIACLEEIAWENGWIDRAAVETAASSMGKSAYGDYLRALLQMRD